MKLYSGVTGMYKAGNDKKRPSRRLYSSTGVVAAALLINSMAGLLPDGAAVAGDIAAGRAMLMPADARMAAAIDEMRSTAPEVYPQHYVADNQGHARFGGYNALDQAAYVAALNEYAELLPEDVRLYNMLVPTSAAFDLDDAYAGLFPDQHQVISEVQQALDDRFAGVDIWDALAAHQGEYLYFRTDHHWTALAGYYAYAELGRVLGYQPCQLSDLTQVDSGVAFLGSIYQATGSHQLAAGYDELCYYRLPYRVEHVYWDNSGRPKVTEGVYKEWYYRQNNKYAFFMGGDLPYIRLRTDAGTGRKLAVIKDSYANTVLPLLTAHFDEIHVIDPRNSNFNALDIIEDNDIKDVLFINYARVVCLPEFSNGLLELTQRQSVEIQPVP